VAQDAEKKEREDAGGVKPVDRVMLWKSSRGGGEAIDSEFENT